jgi:mannosyltransferase
MQQAGAGNGRRAALLLGGIVAAAFLLRLWRLGGHGLWTDEAYTLNVALRSAAGVLAERDQTPPLFALVLHVWIQVAGTGAAAVRLPSVLAGTGTVLLVHRVALRYLRPGTALGVAGMVALSLYFVILSQEARAFSFLLLLTAGSYLALLRLQERWTWGRAAAYAAVTVLLLYSHLYGVFFLAAQHAHLLASGWRRWADPRWLGIQAAIGLLFLPWLPALLEATDRVGDGFWIEAPGVDEFYWTRFILSGSRVLGYVLPALAAWALVQDLQARRRPPAAPAPPGPAPGAAAPAGLLWAWLVLPVAVPYLVSYAYPMFTPRYVLPAAIPLMVLAARALERGLEPRWRAAAMAGILAIQAVTLGAYFAAPGELVDSRQDWPAAAQLIEGQARPGAVAVFNKGYCDSGSDRDLACAYALHARRQDIRLVPFFFEDRGVSRPVDPESVRELGPLVGNASDVWVLYSYPSDEEMLIPGELERLGYHAAGNWSFKRVDVHRFLRG